MPKMYVYIYIITSLRDQLINHLNPKVRNAYRGNIYCESNRVFNLSLDQSELDLHAG